MLYEIFSKYFIVNDAAFRYKTAEGFKLSNGNYTRILRVSEIPSLKCDQENLSIHSLAFS
jgi:hypothetical protein